MRAIVLGALVALGGCGDGASKPDGGVCGVVGTWVGTVNGTTETVVYDANGTFTLSVMGQVVIAGNYSLVGTTLTITDPTCGAGVNGIYSITFAADCRSASLAVVQDACTDRKNSANGDTFFKQP